MSHTPGLWYVSDDGLLFAPGPSVRTPSRHIARMGWDTPEDQGNARLIAAAPDMLGALQAIANEPCNHGPHFCPREVAAAAIAKATKDQVA